MNSRNDEIRGTSLRTAVKKGSPGRWYDTITQARGKNTIRRQRPPSRHQRDSLGGKGRARSGMSIGPGPNKEN
ncbi:MAG: hypothetical protein C4563_03995 [Desulfobulbus sp.]|nr:MAG: hypothetical protein C4563_03995 [Desulfobulbus sp.]